MLLKRYNLDLYITIDIPIWHLLLHNVSPAVFNYEKMEDKCR